VPLDEGAGQRQAQAGQLGGDARGAVVQAWRHGSIVARAVRDLRDFFR
jgi:hypothetical protein